MFVGLAMMFAWDCEKPAPTSSVDGQENVEGGDDQPGESQDPQGGEDQPGGEDKPGEGEQPGGEDNPGGGEDQPGGEDNPGGETPVGPGEEVKPEVLDEGVRPVEVTPKPLHPDLLHEVEYDDFYDSSYDWLDEYGNIDYVCSQGFGTAFPNLKEAQNGKYYILLYQARGSKGGNYIRVRARNGAKLLKITLGSASSTRVAWSFDGKAAKSGTVTIAAGERFSVDATSTGDEICFYCMGTTQSERWELDYVKVCYQGGFVEEDYYVEPKECGPLMKLPDPWKEDFESVSFPVTDKNTYQKYGLTAGPENLQWSTWYGCFSWQHPKEVATFGAKSPQLRVYQEDTEYEKSQFGYLKTEFFVKGLKQVDFDWYFSEYWMCATVSYCEFGSSEWKGAAHLSLENYSDRQTVRHFTYVLADGAPKDAKIKIEIDPATGFPGSGHYDFILDNFVFKQ